MTNIFLDGLPDEDFRGWKYDKDCHCPRCSQFYAAANYVVAIDMGFESQVKKP